MLFVENAHITTIRKIMERCSCLKKLYSQRSIMLFDTIFNMIFMIVMVN